jgi:hypothetical protein|tara:strand:- start:200 stop:382 length:183 start_codon:yes stop_codon:yes gene_type:complete
MATLNGGSIQGGFGGVHHTKRNPAAPSGAVQSNITTRQLKRMKARLEKQKQQTPPANGFG